MKILLINPPNSGRSIPEERYGITSVKQIFRGEPLALEVLAGNLDDHELRILDLKVNPDGLEAELSGFTPDIVALTAMTCEAQTVLRLATQIKQKRQTTVVVGGIHASADPDFFNCEQIDWIVVGLGKQSFSELVQALETKVDQRIPGVARTAPGTPLSFQPRKFSRNDLAEQHPPRYDLVEPYRPQYVLQTLGLQLGFVASAAGCPYDCSFCCISALTDGRYLTATIATVIRDIQQLQTPVIRLVDANTFGNPQHALQLADAIESAGIKKQFLADVRSDTVVRHPELLKRWQEIGLRAVVIGFEEIDDTALGAMNKKSSAAINLQAIEILHRIGLTIVGDFIISPDYTEQQFDKLGDFVKQQQINLPMHTILTPLPGTDLYRQLREKIIIHDLDYYTLTNAVLATRLDEELFYQRYAALLAEGHQSAKV
ncbi:MAG: cobalamin B12-binding domain-containing protein [Desulfuromonadales bacterium]|nr:cobalamin B12-binding domain-containing protein [Desulfuromonadales bacterium]